MNYYMHMSRGITLIEIVVSIGVISLLCAGVTGLSIQLIEKQSIRQDYMACIILLEEARNKSLRHIGSLAHGVHIEHNRFISFSGSDYQNRDVAQDVIVPTQHSMRFEGLQDIIFERSSGRVLNPGTIFFVSPARTDSIEIFTEGGIITDR